MNCVHLVVGILRTGKMGVQFRFRIDLMHVLWNAALVTHHQHHTAVSMQQISEALVRRCARWLAFEAIHSQTW